MQDYEKGKFFNKAFGSAFLARCKKSDTMVVIKMVDFLKKERDSARKEVSILGALKHPNIIKYTNSFEDGGSESFVLSWHLQKFSSPYRTPAMDLWLGLGKDEVVGRAW